MARPTLDRYTHLFETDHESLAEALNRLYVAASTQTDPSANVVELAR